MIKLIDEHNFVELEPFVFITAKRSFECLKDERKKTDTPERIRDVFVDVSEHFSYVSKQTLTVHIRKKDRRFPDTPQISLGVYWSFH